MKEEKRYSYNLFKGPRSSTFEHARELRHDETAAEKKLWGLLRNKQLKGKKFRRQHPFTDHVLDFYCHECKLAIELDGQHHLEKENRESDIVRTNLLEEYGITVIRFRNDEVMNEIEKVLEKIAEYL